MMRTPAGGAGDRGDGAANALYTAHGAFAARCLDELEAEVPFLAEISDEDWEDLHQEAEVALWIACRRYARHGPAGMSGQSFTEFARVHMRGYLKEYVTRWWCDPDFVLLPDLEERQGVDLWDLGSLGSVW